MVLVFLDQRQMVGWFTQKAPPALLLFRVASTRVSIDLDNKLTTLLLTSQDDFRCRGLSGRRVLKKRQMLAISLVKR